MYNQRFAANFKKTSLQPTLGLVKLRSASHKPPHKIEKLKFGQPPLSKAGKPQVRAAAAHVLQTVQHKAHNFPLRYRNALTRRANVLQLRKDMELQRQIRSLNRMARGEGNAC